MQAESRIESLSLREDVVLSEFVLTELYLLLRNPAVLANPLTAPEAGEVIQNYNSQGQVAVGH